MWVFMADAFLSVVVPSAADQRRAGVEGDVLAVRARRRGDLERAFPGARVHAWEGRDYPFRAFVPREDVAERMREAVMTLAASNFKGSVRETGRRDAYGRVWQVMLDWGGGFRRRAGTLLDDWPVRAARRPR